MFSRVEVVVGEEMEYLRLSPVWGEELNGERGWFRVEGGRGGGG